MARARWGTFSVIDHAAYDAFAREVLLYDKLVLPKYREGDEADRRRWEQNKWDPGRLDEVIDELGDLAVVREWGQDRARTVEARLEELSLIQYNALDIETTHARYAPAYRITRDILAEEERRRLEERGEDILVVAAYQSVDELRTEFGTGTTPQEAAVHEQLGVLLAHEFLVPSAELNPKEAMERVIGLARDAKFIASRGEFYRWQERAVREILAGQRTPESAVEEMRDLLATYNRLIEDAVRKVHKRWAYTLAGIALAAAPVALKALAVPKLLSVLGFAGPAARLAQFVHLERSPQVDAGSARPAAMFHMAQEAMRS